MNSWVIPYKICEYLNGKQGQTDVWVTSKGIIQFTSLP